MPDDLVSVIVPSYNKAPYIGEAVDSVVDQAGVCVEVIVVDDASTDDTLDELARFGERIRVHRSASNRGAARSRNFGAEEASGSYFLFLDADDRLDPGTLAPLVQALGRRTDAVAACPWKRLRRVGDGWEVYSVDKPLDPPGGDPVAAWLGNWYIPPCAILWPRELFERHGGWDVDLTASDDEELMIRVLLRGAGIMHASGGMAYYRSFDFDAAETLSTTHTRAHTRSRVAAFDKIWYEAVAQDRLSDYRHALAQAYLRSAYTHASRHEDLKLDCLRKADLLLADQAVSTTLGGRLARRLLGLAGKERLRTWMRGIMGRRTEQKGSTP